MWHIFPKKVFMNRFPKLIFKHDVQSFAKISNVFIIPLDNCSELDFS